MKLSKKLSVSAILAALAVIILLIGSFVETVTLATAAIASVCVMVAVIELGASYSIMIYLVSSVLGIVLLPIKDPAIFYVLSFGYYPIVKYFVEKIRVKAIPYVIKGAVFTAAFSALFYIAVKFLVPEAGLTKYLIFIYPAALLVFFVFDYSFSRLSYSYVTKLRKRLGINKLLK